MEDIITRTRIGKTWNRIPMDFKMVPKIYREERRPERPVLKCHKCWRTSCCTNTCTKKTKINEAQVIEEAQCTEEKKEPDQESAVSEDIPVDYYPIENITAFFEVTEVHTHLPQYSEDCYNLINIQDSIMCKTKHARGKVNSDTGAFCTCVGKEYLQAMLPGCKNNLLPIEGVQCSSSSNNMYPLGILDTNIVFPHPAGSIRMKTWIVVMDNCTSQQIILGSNYFNIYGIDINKKRQIFYNWRKEKTKICFFQYAQTNINSIFQKNTYKEEFVANQLFEAQINRSLSPKMRHELIDVLYTYKNAFDSDNEPLGIIKGNEVDITLNIDRPYPPVLRRPAYLASPTAREALEKHIQELLKLGVLRKVGYNEEAKVKATVIIAWHNDKSRMVGDFGALNTYTAPDRYPIPRIQEALTQLSNAKYTTSMIPFGIKNSPSHYKRKINTVSPTELSEGWLIMWALANTSDNPAYVALEAEPHISIKGINITDIGTELFEEVRESYKQDRN
ncbi:hypothetical protein O181_008922 [Austropuccinia psidii MF-1]|uniref:Uncharacterized protein n=1 Tax=Austropuccinia psidii MF-1 TaxID=1389203 RepID=A0A9Q3BPS0_9BASI|nr:hypothetical protein [Austropuccinia psidii MF-1]